MRTLTTLFACALMAVAIPAYAQSNTGSPMRKELQNNGSPSGANPSHAKQPGDRDTESGKAPSMTEGRSSATDPGNSAGTGAMKPGGTGTGMGTQNGNMAPGGGPGESGGGASGK